MRIKLMDKTEVIVTKTQADQVSQLLTTDMEFINVAGTVIRRSSIMAIVPGGYTEAERAPESRQLASRATMTDEQRIQARAKLREIKAEFMARRTE